MDYGQPTQPNGSAQEPEFFTSGAGTNSENENTFEAENNLDLTNNQVSWGTTEARDPRNLGGSAIASAEKLTPATTPETPKFPEAPQIPTESYNSTPELGQVVPAMPPGYTAPPTATSEQTPPTQPFDESALKTTDKLDLRAVKIVDDAIAKLNQDGDIASFYDTARGMMETNLANSYNRKLAA